MSDLKSNVKDLFEGWNTIPNWLSFLRIALIPVFTVLFIKEYYIAAIITMAFAAFTDLLDGKIARKYNMVSNLGKILDPIADKLSQMAIVVILLIKYWDGPLKYILFLFIIKEVIMLIGGAILLSKGMRPTAAEIWGKVATTVFYVFMILIIAFGPDGALLGFKAFANWELSSTVTTVMVVISAVFAFASLFGYAPGFIRQMKENKAKNSNK